MMHWARLIPLLLSGLCLAPAARADGILQCPVPTPRPLFFNTTPASVFTFLSFSPITPGTQASVSWNNLTGNLTGPEILGLDVNPSSQLTETCTGSGFVSNFFGPTADIFVPCSPNFTGTVFKNRSASPFSRFITLENDTDQSADFLETLPGLPPMPIPLAAGATVTAAVNVPPGAQLDASCSSSATGAGLSIGFGPP